MKTRRLKCPHCGTECYHTDLTCLECGENLVAPSSQAEKAVPADKTIPLDGSAYITFCDTSSETPASSDPSPASETLAKTISFSSSSTRTAVTLTGEVVEVPETSPTLSFDTQPPSSQPTAARIGGTEIAAQPVQEVFYLTFCKHCGFQNEEGTKECTRCRQPLEVVLTPVGEVAPVPRAWGFDVLGVAWIVLGFAAIYSGFFLLKADPEHPGTTWADFLWTGIVAAVPGILIFMRHYFCKFLFWLMTLGSLMVWGVIGFLWYFGHLFVSDNNQLALIWLSLLSVLSVFSYFTVRANDAFDLTF